MRDNHRLKKILIAGGGTAGWMTAAAFAKALIPAGYEVVLIESDEIGTVGVGEATIPTIKAFNALLGFNEFDFLKNTQGTYKLGIEFINWGRLGHRYMHPFGNIGVPHGPLPFYQYWLKYHFQGKSQSIEDFSVTAHAAHRSRFSTTDTRSHILSGLDYAFHFDATLYAQYLRTFAESAGVNRIEGVISSVGLQENNGFIESVTLKDGRTFTADFFIDCTGFKSLLLAEALNTKYDDWNHFLFCDSALAAQTNHVGPPLPFTRSIAREAGWQWWIPLQHRVGNGYVYSSQYLDDERAKQDLIKNISGELVSEPRLIRFTPGVRKKIWNKNCVAIGLSAGFLEPLESTSIHLIQSSIVKLINMFPTSNFDESDVDQYNNMIMKDYYLARDFVILHYMANDGADTDFWRNCQAMLIPESLQSRIELYRRNGRIFSEPTDIFKEASWISVLIGQKIIPFDYHPLVDALSDNELDQYMITLRLGLQQAVSSLPDYNKFIATYCKSA